MRALSAVLHLILPFPQDSVSRWGARLALSTLPPCQYLEWVPSYVLKDHFGDAIVGSIYGVLDGAVGGVVLAWLYSRLSA